MGTSDEAAMAVKSNVPLDNAQILIHERSRRGLVLTTVRATSAGSPSRVLVAPDRSKLIARGDAAKARSIATRTKTRARTPRTVAPPSGGDQRFSRNPHRFEVDRGWHGRSRAICVPDLGRRSSGLAPRARNRVRSPPTRSS